MAQLIHKTPHVEASEGHVLVDGPGIVATVTPEVALELGAVLEDRGMAAAVQQAQRDGELDREGR